MQLQLESQFAKSNLLRKCGLLAHTSAAFLKNCCTEKLFICLRLIIDKPLFLEKPPESGSARLGHIPSLPWESQLPLKPYLSLQPSDFEGNCDSFRFSLRFLLQFFIKFHLLRKCGLLAHTSAAFLKNCCTEKLFILCIVTTKLILFIYGNALFLDEKSPLLFLPDFPSIPNTNPLRCLNLRTKSIVCNP